MKRSLLLTIVLLFSVSAFAQDFSESMYRSLQWRHVGPANMGGRIDDFAVDQNNTSLIYAATASGGLWKSINNGSTWTPVFDDQPASSIGDVTIAPSDPNIVWVGTGEQNNRQSSSWGNGVYRSLDGGRTWAHMGLADSHHIGKIIIDPRDANVVYVAAVGRLWGPNRERGVFKTTDGGKTWTNALFVNEDTGAIDLIIDTQSPSTLYAAMYQRRRTTWGFNGGGPGSAIYKTVDSGANWKKLTSGLPTGDTGRIGLDVYYKNPNIVYAVIENKNGGVFRSEDRGETWRRMSNTNPRPMYYSKIRIDPSNDQRIWVLSADMYYSDDGGRTFRRDVINTFAGNPPTGIHGDFHALWINPSNSDHMLLGSDGGINVSYDRGKTWTFWDSIPIGQFYEVSVDMKKPYNIYGGLQDNGNWRGPSRTEFVTGISNVDWMRVGGGDGFYTVPDPVEPDIVYVESQNGNMYRMDLRTNERKPIRPDPKAGEPANRFDWNSPFIISPHNHRTLYFGAQRLFKSVDRGDSWTASADLTTQTDREKLPIMGVLPSPDMLSRHDGTSSYGQIVTIAESPVREGVIYAGTDDGNVQVSRDGGKTFRNVTDRIPVPKNTYVSRIIGSHAAEGRAYVTFDGHRGNDFKAHVFTTEDFGENWRSISAGIPEGHVVNVIREHPKNPNLLFIGTEFGAYVSFNRGGQWLRFKNNLATVPVDDIAIHPRDNDLIFGTHGRSVSVMDDITALQQLNESVVNSEFTLFDTRTATAYRLHYHTARPGNSVFTAPNPEYGSPINYFLKSKAQGPVKVTILDKDGKVVRELAGTGEPGINRIHWDLRWTPPSPRREGGGGEEEGGGGGGAPEGPLALPGDYTVRVEAAGQQQSKPLKVEEDPRIQITEADRRAHFDALTALTRLYSTADGARRSMADLRTKMTEATRTLREYRETPKPLLDSAESLSKQVVDVAAKVGAGSGGFGGSGGAFVPRVSRLIAALDGYTARPTPSQMEDIRRLTDEWRTLETQVKQLVDRDIPALNNQMIESKIPFIRLR